MLASDLNLFLSIGSYMRSLQIYTDGACYPNPGTGSWGYVILENEMLVKKDSYYELTTTNNRMEYLAAIKALSNCEKSDDVVLYSDSQLLVNTYNQWMHSWAKKGFAKKKGIKNLDLVLSLYELHLKLPNVRFEWVKGHSTNDWNNYVDELCSLELSKLGITSFETSKSYFVGGHK